MILRCTAKLLALLNKPPLGEVEPSPGDWYGNLLWFDGRKCLLVTHAGTLFSVFVPDVRAAQLRPPGPLVVGRIHEQLAVEGFPSGALGFLDPVDVTVARTADRSVLGCMNELAFACEVAVADAGGLGALDLARLHHHLQRNLSSARGYVPAVEPVGAGLGASATSALPAATSRPSSRLAPGLARRHLRVV